MQFALNNNLASRFKTDALRHGRRLGNGTPKFEVGTAHASVPQNILRSSVKGCAGKYEVTKKGEMEEFCV